MKKLLPALLMVSALTAFGCGQKSPDPAMDEAPEAVSEALSKPTLETQEVPNNMCMPSWELSPPVSPDGIYGSGQANYQSPVLTRQVADQRAREAIAATLENKTANMVSSFLQQSGTGETARTAEFAESVSKAVVVQSLHGAAIEQRHACPDGTIFSLAFYPLTTYKEELVTAAEQQAQSNIDEKNLADAFLAQESLERLDAQIGDAFAE